MHVHIYVNITFVIFIICVKIRTSAMAEKFVFRATERDRLLSAKHKQYGYDRVI